MPRNLLILGGTAEARQLADRAVARWPDLRVVTALAGRTESPARPAGEVVTGGFGGAAGLAEFLRGNQVSLLVDATHPFAAEISKNAANAAQQTDVPRLVLARAPWKFPADKGVIFVRSINAAKRTLENAGKRVFLAIGRQEVTEFTNLFGKFFLLRFVDEPAVPPPFADCLVVTGRPGDRAAEEKLLRTNSIDTLVAKNGGSDASRAKVDAALDLGLTVILIDPPPPPPPPHAETVDEALDWIAANLTAV